MNISLTCFKTYDIRGTYPDEINEDLAYLIGRAYASILNPRKVVLGHDIRLSGPSLLEALARGLMDSGVDIISIGECGTEEIYFAVSHWHLDGGICITASHNPASYNGMKLVKENSKPVGQGTGLEEIREAIKHNQFTVVDSNRKGSFSTASITKEYRQKLLSFTDLNRLRPLTLVVNPGNGGAGRIIDSLEEKLPYTFIKLHYQSDGRFPNGVPNPMLPENRQATADAVIDNQADMGIAWDGDFDRCFFFDEKGNFVEGYYLVGLLAEHFIQQSKDTGQSIVHDPRLYWNTLAIIDGSEARAIKSKTGHAFIKETMRLENAVYGGEMSAHHYFRDFYYCDNGNIPWLVLAEILAQSDKPLSHLLADRICKFPCSGEINLQVDDPKSALAMLKKHYIGKAVACDYTDGLSMEFANWRFNVRSSNTEPLIRVNVESRQDKQLLQRQTQAILSLLNNR
ncbi:phosphomannomutase [Thalassotalea mangrovi]|uniref:phosphomannomutase n=1 Tax=Thalassotalea mangrovi TaxID=2572245 RepID=A0A4U1B1Z9_9GAMM|nr:phosphomannomutase [Thalassotalea mangrovi]TKB43547.1 phosphomannomutase [Thalassotalea mangrovi]